MLNKEVVALLSRQVVLEFESAYLYTAMAALLNDLKVPGMSHWMRVQAVEETGHGAEFLSFLLDHDATPALGPVAAPKIKAKTVVEVFKAALVHEQLVTERITELADAAMTGRQYAAFNLAQAFLKEQVEEEHSVRTILDRLALCGNGGEGLLTLDLELGRRMAGTTIPLLVGDVMAISGNGGAPTA